jgi:hypothetical protein
MRFLVASLGSWCASNQLLRGQVMVFSRPFYGVRDIESVVIGHSGGNPVRGLTPEQQHAVVLFFQRHAIKHTACPQCPHSREQEQEQ